MISETWLNSAIPDSAIMLPQYNMIRQDRHKVDQKKGGEICIYVKDTCNYNIEELEHVNEVTNDYEILGIKVKFANIKPCFLFGVYRPPKGKPSELIYKLSRTLKNIDLLRNEIYILGDMNLDYQLKQSLSKLHITNF